MNTRRMGPRVGLALVLFLSLGCDKENYGPPGGLSTWLTGKWVLEKTVSPRGVSTPGGAYNQTLQVGNDSRSNFLAISRNGVEVVREVEKRSVANSKDYTVDIYYYNGQMIRFFLSVNRENNGSLPVTEIQVTQFMKEYSAAADTVRYFYTK